jgi:hypothetical protein
MSSYPLNIRRCQYIKVNGTQCGSPALREDKHCYFHMGWVLKNREINMQLGEHGTVTLPTMTSPTTTFPTLTLPTLEDANSVQMGLAEIMRVLVTKQIDHRTAALLLYALQTASSNLKRISFEPEPTHVVIDRDSVERRPLGSSAWSAVVGREYDDLKHENSSETSKWFRHLLDQISTEPDQSGKPVHVNGDDGDDDEEGD